MNFCPNCAAKLAAGATTCAACGATVPQQRHFSLKTLYAHIPHPHIEHRKKYAPKVVSEGEFNYETQHQR